MSTADLESVERALDRLTPTEKLELIERVARSLRGNANEPILDEQRHKLQRLLEETLRLPIGNPADGFSNLDHDRILYGAPT